MHHLRLTQYVVPFGNRPLFPVGVLGFIPLSVLSIVGSRECPEAFRVQGNLWLPAHVDADLIDDCRAFLLLGEFLFMAL